MATYELPLGAQIISPAGYPTGLARPSQPLSSWGMSGPGAMEMLGGRMVSYAEIYRTNTWAAICINKLFRDIARLPLKAYKRTDTGRERLTSGILHDLLRTPWPLAAPTHFKQALALPTLVHGGSLVRKVRRPRATGQVVAFQPLVWSLLSVHRQAGGEVEVWETSQPGVPQYLDPLDVVHVGFRSLDGPLAVSPLEQLGTTIRVDEAAQRHQESLLRNGARPPSAIEASAEFLTEIDPDERQEMMVNLRLDVDEIYGGPDQQGKPAILPPGLKWNAIGHTAVEAELIEQRKLTREEVAACYGIPPPLVGILEHATLANVDSFDRMLYTTVLAPWLTLIEESLGAQLIEAEPTIRGDVYVEFDLSEVLKGDLLRRAQALALQIASGVLTIDEARTAENRTTFGLPETSRPLYAANNLKPAGLPQQGRPPSDAQVGDAAAMVADMNEHELMRALRDNGGVTAAILAYASQSNGNGHLPDEVDT